MVSLGTGASVGLQQGALLAQPGFAITGKVLHDLRSERQYKFVILALRWCNAGKYSLRSSSDVVVNNASVSLDFSRRE